MPGEVTSGRTFIQGTNHYGPMYFGNTNAYIDTNQVIILKPRIDNQANPATNYGVEGQICYNTVSKKLGWHDGTKWNWVDISTGYQFKDPARVASKTNVASLTTSTATIDSETLVAGDRILLTAQNNAYENGLWEVPSTGTNWFRPADFSTGTQVPGAFIVVTEGTLNHDKIFLCTTDNPINLYPAGTPTSLTFVELAHDQYTFSAPLKNTSGTVTLEIDANTLAVNGSNQLYVKKQPYQFAVQELSKSSAGVDSHTISLASPANFKLSSWYLLNGDASGLTPDTRADAGAELIVAGKVSGTDLIVTFDHQANKKYSLYISGYITA